MSGTKYIQKQIKEIEDKIKATKRLIESLSDAAIKELAEEDVKSLESQKKQLENSLNAITTQKMEVDLPQSTNKGDVIMEIRAGTGGNEAGLFANDLYRMYTKFAEKMGWKVSEISKNEGGLGNIKEVALEIKGNKKLSPYELLKHEGGVHRVQRVPATESSGRVHTSTATVAVLPLVSDIQIDIKPEDLRIDTFRASGAGGQHVNKTDSAVRITHIPTGVVAQCQDERSQHKNRERAMSILKSRLFRMMKSQQKNSIDELRAEQVGTAERSEKIRTYNFPQNRVTDHRIKKSWFGIEKILSGEIPGIRK